MFDKLEIARLLRTSVGLELSRAEFAEKFVDVLSSPLNAEVTWNATGAAVDYCRAHNVVIPIPESAIALLLRANDVEHRIVGLKGLHYCHSLPDNQIADAIHKALLSQDEDETFGGLYELGIIISNRSDKRYSPLAMSSLQSLGEPLQKLLRSHNERIREAASRRLDEISELK